MQWKRDPEQTDTQAMARIIFDAALLESGYILPSPKDFNQRIYDLLARSHNIKSDLSKAPGFDDSVRLVLSTLALHSYRFCTKYSLRKCTRNRLLIT